MMTRVHFEHSDNLKNGSSDSIPQDVSSDDSMFEKVTLKYVPNYKINLIDPRKLEDLKCFKTDLQMVFGMLKYKNSKVQMKEFVNKNKTFFHNWTKILTMRQK